MDSKPKEDKGKAKASAPEEQKTYTEEEVQRMLARAMRAAAILDGKTGNTQVKPKVKPERINFGNESLKVFHPMEDREAGGKFRIKEHINVSKEVECLADNLWRAFNKNDRKWMVSAIHALTEHENGKHGKFKYYLVINGKVPGVYDSWLEVSDTIKGVKGAKFQGYNNLQEIYNAARKNLGTDYFVAKNLQVMQSEPLEYRMVVCTSCELVQNEKKTLQAHCDSLSFENSQLLEKFSELQRILSTLRTPLKTVHTRDVMAPAPVRPNPFKSVEPPKQPMRDLKALLGSPAQVKNTEQAKSSLTKPNESSSSVNDEPSPAQTVAGKDESNPLMADDLPKIIEDSKSFGSTLEEESSEESEEEKGYKPKKKQRRMFDDNKRIVG